MEWWWVKTLMIAGELFHVEQLSVKIKFKMLA